MPGPILIAHRGASGYRPEHTLAAYELAMEMGADFIEPDIVPTKDGVLVARHENEISGTTDIASLPRFAGQRTTKVIDGVELTGWFTEDFTLAELKGLRARERIPHLRPNNRAYDGHFEVATLQEISGLIRRFEAGHPDRRTGIYCETKHPAYFRSIGLPLEELLAEQLAAAGFSGHEDLAFIESFEPSSLQLLKTLTGLRLVQLIEPTGAPADGSFASYDAMITPAGLTEVARYASAIGVHKDLILARDSSGSLLPPTSLVADAHSAGLDVHVWTFRAENAFLPRDFRQGKSEAGHGDMTSEVRTFVVEAGIDGLFSDHPDLAAQGLEQQQSL